MPNFADPCLRQSIGSVLTDARALDREIHAIFTGRALQVAAPGFREIRRSQGIVHALWLRNDDSTAALVLVNVLVAYGGSQPCAVYFGQAASGNEPAVNAVPADVFSPNSLLPSPYVDKIKALRWDGVGDGMLPVPDWNTAQSYFFAPGFALLTGATAILPAATAILPSGLGLAIGFESQEMQPQKCAVSVRCYMEPIVP